LSAEALNAGRKSRRRDSSLSAEALGQRESSVCLFAAINKEIGVFDCTLGNNCGKNSPGSQTNENVQEARDKFIYKSQIFFLLV